MPRTVRTAVIQMSDIIEIRRTESDAEAPIMYIPWNEGIIDSNSVTIRGADIRAGLMNETTVCRSMGSIIDMMIVSGRLRVRKAVNTGIAVYTRYMPRERRTMTVISRPDRSGSPKVSIVVTAAEAVYSAADTIVSIREKRDCER